VEILYLLIPLSIVLLIAAVWAFVWAVKSGQFEDLEGPAYRIIMNDDDDPMIPPPPGQTNSKARPAEHRSASTDGD